MNITVSGYNRPAYLSQTLAALRECLGIEHCRVMVLLDPCDETPGQQDIARRYGFECAVYRERQGCNKAILNALAHGFQEMGSEFHLHFEDDCVPCRGALRWFAWARDHYRDNPGVMNVSGYQRNSNGCLGESGLRRWFTPWGWGTWIDRWRGLAAGWSRTQEISWDVAVNHVLRAGRYEAFPTVSHVQNIGGERGTHVPSPEWHALNHHVPQTADDIGGETPLTWRPVRLDDHADHA